MRLFGYEFSARRIPGGMRPPTGGSSGGWTTVVRESFPGAWQQNVEVSAETVLAYWAVYACTTLISGDVGKLRLRLVEQDDDGIWQETTSPAFSPVLRKPNRYQTFNKFAEQWVASKLTYGNTYVLKERDNRGLVTSMYVLDPRTVWPFVSPDGSVFYQCGRYDLAGTAAIQLTDTPTVPASEIIHDLMVPLWHPLVGVTPIYACGMPAVQGLRIQDNATALFSNYSQPGGFLTAPGAISDDTAKRLRDQWIANYGGANVGRIAVGGDGLKYESFTMNPVDAQLIEQLKWTEEPICGCYHVPVFLINSSKTPPYGNSEILMQQYWSQCIQTLVVNFETALEAGLELPAPYGVEFDIDDLIWMDTATKTKAAHDSIAAGALSPDEARKKYYGLGPVPGGDSPYMQQQYFSLAALAARDVADPFAKPPAPALPPEVPPAVEGKSWLWRVARSLASDEISYA